MFYIRYRTNPFDYVMQLLDMMRTEVPGEFQDTFTFNGIFLPASMGNWQRGTSTTEETFQTIKEYYDMLEQQNHFKHPDDKRILISLLQLMLNPTIALEVLQPIQAAWDLVHSLKHESSYQLFILSNIDTETYNLLYDSHKELFDLFHGVVTSWETQQIKPCPSIFTHLLTTYNLNPEECIFIDDQIENIDAAESLGIQTIHKKRRPDLTAHLKRKGLL